MNRLSVGILLCGFSILLAGGAKGADAVAGKAVYAAKCKTCHGADGTPPAGMAKAMGVKPMNDPSVQAKSDDALKSAVTKGLGKMKPVAGVAGTDLDNVVAAVRAMK